MATLYTEQEIKSIIMACPGENTLYPPPDIMVDGHGNRLYAYVTLITLGDSYIPGAIVMAHSVRRLGSQADLVVLVTEDVSEDGLRILATFFDKVVMVNNVIVPNWRTKKQKHRLYLNYVFTKFHMFNLTQYKKVLLIDADALVLQHPDHLFTLNTPAGCLLQDKNDFITYNKEGDYILPLDGKIKWYDLNCKCCAHGELIPKAMTDRVATNVKNSGIGGGLVLLSPKKGEFEAIIKDVTGKNKMSYLVQNKFVWPEQQYLTLRYSGKWTSINPRFFGLQGYPHWSVLFGLQYGGDKPFVLDSKIDIQIRLEYPDYVLWHKFYSEILEKFPFLKHVPALTNVNKLHSFFVVTLQQQKKFLSRFMTNRTVEQVKELIRNGLRVKHVNDAQLDMYYLDTRLCFMPFDVKAMFPTVAEYDYLKPIELLSASFVKTDYYKNLLTTLRSVPRLGRASSEKAGTKIKVKTYTTRLDRVFQGGVGGVDEVDVDNIMLQYVKCRPNCFVITLWPSASRVAEQVVDELGKSGDVYYLRKLVLSYGGLRNLMFWMYNEFSFHERETFIGKKMDYIKAVRDAPNEVSMIIFDNTKNVKISGQGSDFKKYIRKYVLRLLGVDGMRGNDVVHINDFFYQTVSYCEMMLNRNSIFLLDNQSNMFDSKLNLDHNNKVAHLRFQTFIKFLYTNLTLFEISKIVTMGGAVLYAFGVRTMSDIDSIMVGMNVNTQELEDLMYDNFQNKKTKFEFADMGIEGKYWRESWTVKNRQLLDYFGIRDMSDVVCNPRYHFYYQGVKMYLLDYEIVRKFFRIQKNFRIWSQDYADFIVMLLYKCNLVCGFMTLDRKGGDKDKNMRMEVIRAPDGVDIFAGVDREFVESVVQSIKKKYPRDISNKVNADVVASLLHLTGAGSGAGAGAGSESD